MNKRYADLSAYDGFEFGTQRTITPEGFLEAPANIARSGVQMYRARELKLDAFGIAGDSIIRLHRPDEELFDPNVINSIDGKPVIGGDTHKTVTAENWKDLAVGEVHGPARNGHMLSVNRMVIRDKDAIGDVQSGKKYLSIGYKFDLDMTPGVNAQGEQYDGIQRNIRPNHVLITNSPRGGYGLSIADSATEQGEKRKMKKIVINGVPVEVGDSEHTIIESLIAERDAARNQKPSIKIGDKTITGEDAIIAEITGRDSQIADLKSKVPTQEQLAAEVNERVRIVGDASKLVADFKSEGKTNKQIHTEVLTAVTGADASAKNLVAAILSGKSIGDASDDVLSMAFKAVAASVPAKKDVNGADQAVAAALTGHTREAGDAVNETKLVGRDAFVQRQHQAWKPATK